MSEADPELGECPRNQWYAPYGRKLRAQGWRLRKQGEKWNATHALIERWSTTATSQPREWDRATTLHAIGTYSDDTIAQLFWIGRTMEMKIRRKNLETGGVEA